MKKENNYHWAVHFGKSYPFHLGYDKTYHRIWYTNDYWKAKKWLNRLHKFKNLDWDYLESNTKGAE